MSLPIVQTAALRSVGEAIEWASGRPWPVLVIGTPGTGKTSALLHFQPIYRAFYLEVDDGSKSPKGMYERLAALLDVWAPSCKTYSERIRAVEHDLRHIGRDRLEARHQRRPMIFVDEQQRFEANALRELLRLCGATDTSLVLAGNAEKLTKTHPAENGALAQIHSRIGMRVLLDKPSPEDCRAIAAAFNVEGMDAYRALEGFGIRNNFRDLVRVLDEARELTEGTGIRLPHIHSVAQAIYGNRDALSNPKSIN
jgi:DNA transposition AAA+ family ATPase